MRADLGFDVVELAPCPVLPATPRLRETAFRVDAWTSLEIDLLIEMFGKDASFDEIAIAIGRGRAGVADKAHQLGLRRNSARPWSDIEDAMLRERYSSVATSIIAQEHGRSCAAIYARAGLLGLTEGNAPPYEPWEDLQIRTGYEQGVPVQQIAVLIGRPFAGVVSRASTLGLRHLKKPADWSDAEAQRALELANEGHRYLAIIDMLAGEGFPRRTKNGFGQYIRILGYGRGWGRPWLPEEDDLLRRAYAEGLSLTPLRERLGRTKDSIRAHAFELGLQGTHAKTAGWRTAPPWSAEEEQRLRERYGTVKNKVLVEEFGRPYGAIAQRARALGLKHPWMRPYTPDERRAIGIAWRRGVSIMDLAQALNRDPTVVSRTATSLGMAFSDPRRPKRGPRTPRKHREQLTLDAILALEPPDPVADGAIEARNRVKEAKASVNRGAGAKKLNALRHEAWT